jgi:hypothetical protein
VILKSNGSLRGKPPNSLRAKGVEKEEEEEEVICETEFCMSGNKGKGKVVSVL